MDLPADMVAAVAAAAAAALLISLADGALRCRQAAAAALQAASWPGV